MSQRGFTLVETLTATMIGALLTAGIMSMSTFQLSSMRDQTTQIDLQQIARGAASLFQLEARRMGVDPQCAGFEPILSASGRQLTFQSDLDGSGSIDADGELVSYEFEDGSGLYRQSNGDREPLIAGIDLDGSGFRYFDGAGVEIAAAALDDTARAAVRRIRFALALADESLHGGTDAQLGVDISSDVTLRNRFFLGNSTCE